MLVYIENKPYGEIVESTIIFNHKYIKKTLIYLN